MRRFSSRRGSTFPTCGFHPVVLSGSPGKRISPIKMPVLPSPPVAALRGDLDTGLCSLECGFRGEVCLLAGVREFSSGKVGSQITGKSCRKGRGRESSQSGVRSEILIISADASVGGSCVERLHADLSEAANATLAREADVLVAAPVGVAKVWQNATFPMLQVTIPLGRRADVQCQQHICIQLSASPPLYYYSQTMGPPLEAFCNLSF
ncbi:unnamed protein product [Boreogadus saida]